MYSVFWTEQSRKDLETLEKQVVQRIIQKIEQIKHTPYHFAEHLTDIKAWKLRVGDYRVVLDIDESKKELVILTIGHRRNIYKKM
jgi:mRNA interferase RelE/StbE